MQSESEALKRGVAALLDDVCDFLSSFRLASWPTTVAAMAAFCSVLILSNFAIATAAGRFIDSLYGATGGWIGPQLVYPLCALGLMWLAFSRLGGLSWNDLGWRRSALIQAITVVVAFWLCTQGSLWIVSALRGDVPTWRWRWRGQGGAVLAALNAQLLGNSLAEETLFRGYLLPQAYLRVARVSRRRVALIAGLLAPLALSVLIHVPRLVYEEKIVGADLIESMFWTFWFGIALALVFLVTRNLFICVGLHAVWNARPTMIEASWQHLDRAWWVWVAMLIIGWALQKNNMLKVSGRE